MEDTGWQAQGKCYGLIYEGVEDLWFPPDNPGGPKDGHGVLGEPERIRAAKRICRDCPVKMECLLYSIEHNCVGIWGGLDTHERRAWARDRDSRVAS
jgi:hypothetical protein